MTQSVMSDSFIQQGIVDLHQQSVDSAIVAFTQALQHDSGSICAYANRSIAYSIQGNYQHALDDLSRALELSPTHFALYFNRGMLYNRLGDIERAISDFGKAMRLNPSGFRSYFNQAMILLTPDTQPEDLQPKAPTPIEPLQFPYIPVYVPRSKLYKNLLKLHVGLWICG
jgi:tetratricopeptide (TPR) repeat protein